MSSPATPSAAEWKVIRWTFGPAAIAVAAYIAIAYFDRRAECEARCTELGSAAWALRMNAGGRFNLGTHCDCGRPAAARAASAAAAASASAARGR